ncbi:retrovirus-related pol polyprotein from transposon TNT 1-94 [Tanacetum coccineum]
MAAVEVLQTLEYRGGQLNATPVLEVENFTNWKKRFMCHIIDERKTANLDQRLKSLIMSVFPNDQMKSVINYLTTKSTWDDLILYHEGPSNVKESRVMDLKLPKKWLSFCQSLKNTNHVKDLEIASLFGKLKYEENLIDSIYETEKCKSLVSATPLSTAFLTTSIIQDFQDSPNDEEDTKSSHEYLNDLEEEYQARALLAKSKRFFKKGTQRFSSAKVTDQTECHKCGKKGHFARDCWSKTSIPSYQSPFQPKLLYSSEHKPKPRRTKDFKAKYNKVKAKLAHLSSSDLAPSSSSDKNKGLIAETYDWDEEEVSSDENDVTEVKAIMELTDEERVSVSKESAKNGEWVKISIQKVHTLLEMEDNNDRKSFLDYLCIDLNYVEEQRNNLLSKHRNLVHELNTCKEHLLVLKQATLDLFNMQYVNTEIIKENQNLRNELKELTSITEAWLNSSNKVNQCISEQIPTQKRKILGIDQLTEDTSSSGLKDLHPLPPLEKLTGAEPISGPKTIKSILKSKSTFKAETLKGITINEPSSAPARGNKSSSVSKTNSAHAGKLKNVKMEDDPPLDIVMKELNELKLQISKNKSSYFRNKNSQQVPPNALQNKYKTQFKMNCELCGQNNHLSENCYEVFIIPVKVNLPQDPDLLRPFMPFPSCLYVEDNDHQSDDFVYYPICEICGSYDYNTHGHNRIISLRRGIKPRNPQHIIKNCETCGSNVHTTSDHNDIEWFKKREALQAKKVESFKASKTESSNTLRSNTPTKRKSTSSTCLLLKKKASLVDKVAMFSAKTEDIAVVAGWGKTGGFDQITNKDAIILYSLANGININYSNIFWEDIIIKLKKKQREKVVPYTRFFSLLIMHKMKEGYGDDEQATGGPTSLGVTSEERANPQLNSGMSVFNLNKPIFLASFIIHSESASGCDASADSTAKADPGLSTPNDSIPQQQGMDKGTKNTLYDHLFAGTDPHVLADQTKSVSEGLETVLTQPIIGKGSSSNARKFEEEESSNIIKLEDLAKLVSNVEPIFKYLDSPEDDPVIVVDDSDEDKEDKVHTTPNAKTEDTSVPKSSSLRSFQIQELTNQVLILQSQKHKLELKNNKVEAEAALLKAQTSFPNELPAEFFDVPSQVEMVQAKLKTLDALPSLLNKVTNALNQFAQAITSKKTGGDNEDKGKKALSLEEAEKESTDSASDDETYVTGSMVEPSRTKKLKKFDFITEDGRHIYLTEEEINHQKKLRRAKAKATKQEGEGPITLKVYRQDGASEIIPNFKASTRMDYIHTTEAELSINLDIPLSKHDPLDKLNDLANQKRKHVADIHDYFKANKRLKSSFQYEDHLPGTVLNEPVPGMILFNSYHRHDFVTVEDFRDFPNTMLYTIHEIFFRLHQGHGLEDHAWTFSSLLLAKVDKRNLNPLKQMRIIEQLRQ